MTRLQLIKNLAYISIQQAIKLTLLFPIGGSLHTSSRNYAIAIPTYLFQLLSTIFHPTLIMRQVLALTILQILYESSKSISRTFKRWSTIGTTSRITRECEEAKTYLQWTEANTRLQQVLAKTRRPPTIHETTDNKDLLIKSDLYRSLLRKRDIHGLMFHLRKDLLRAHMQGHLFTRNRNVYRNTVVAALRAVSDFHTNTTENIEDAHYVSIPERLAFFNETRHSFGRSALCLSGGATMGLYHIGVVKALYEASLLPRVISGASAGSIIAAILGTRTNEEISDVFHFKNINATFFGVGHESQKTSIDEYIAMLPPPLPMLLAGARRKANKGYALDIRVLEKALRENCGDVTFQEAFDRTGRIVNIVVTPTRSGRIPMVLNYLTSPHVLMWSASLASCAVPGVFEPVELRARAMNGEEIPYFPRGQRWSDGSVENDLPMQRLSELFNVNFFVVSQVNPHALFFAGTTLDNSRMARVIQFLKTQVKSWIRNVSMLSLQFGVPLLGKGLLPLLTQKYEGDVTLVPRWGSNDLFELFRDPDETRFNDCKLEGERITWPKLRRLRGECEIERVMDRCTKSLRLKLAHLVQEEEEEEATAGNSDGNSSGVKKKKQRCRIPSFTTSASLLSMNALDVGAPGPGNVVRRPSFLRQREV